MKFVICTFARTGSTLLSNIIAGLFSPQKPIGFIDKNPNSISIKDFTDSTFDVIKSHYVEPLAPEQGVNNVYFVTSHRDGFSRINKYPEHWLVFNYQDFLIDKDPNLAIHFVADKLKLKFGLVFSESHFASCRNRLLLMSQKVKELENKPFEVYDDFFHIHGGHRNRG